MMDGFISWLLYSMLMVSLGDGLNCIYPYYDGEEANEGITCQWQEETFYYDSESDEWILRKEDVNDNCIEAMSRKRYWKKRGEK